MRLFDAYLIIDWSANSTPKTGKDSIWYCLLERNNGETRIAAVENPRTRQQASNDLQPLLVDHVRQNFSVLVGCDFAYGYPHGFAKALGLSGGSLWQGTWNLLHDLIKDDANNRNNRFEIAAQLNCRISNALVPFWGCPTRAATTHLSPLSRQRRQPDSARDSLPL